MNFVGCLVDARISSENYLRILGAWGATSFGETKRIRSTSGGFDLTEMGELFLYLPLGFKIYLYDNLCSLGHA